MFQHELSTRYITTASNLQGSRIRTPYGQTGRPLQTFGRIRTQFNHLRAFHHSSIPLYSQLCCKSPRDENLNLHSFLNNHGSVGTTTRLRVGQARNGKFLIAAINFSIRQSFQTGSGTHSASCSTATAGSPSRSKEADALSTISSWCRRYTSISPYTIMVVCSV